MLKKISVLVMAACCWSFGAMAAISQQLKNEYNEAYLTMIASAGCVESYLDHNRDDFSFLKTCGWQVDYFDRGTKKLKTHFALAKKETGTGDFIYLLVFRGSAELNDWGFNLKAGHCAYAGRNLAEMVEAASVPYDKNRPAVHKGFNLYVERILRDYVLLADGRTFKDVFAEIAGNPRCRLLITGHSLGGAVASLLGQRLYDLGMPEKKFQVITFGAPAVGNAAFVREFGKRISLVRCTTTADPVPVSVQTLFHDYKHFGRHVKYDVDIRFSDNQHNSTLYLDNAFLQYYGVRRKIEQQSGDSLRPQSRVVDGVPVVGVQVDISREAEQYRYMPELREFLLDQYAACLPSYRLLASGEGADGCDYRICCEINGWQDRREKVWYVEVVQSLTKGAKVLGMAIYNRRVASGSGNVKSLAENWLEARGDLLKRLPFVTEGAKLNLLTD